MYSRGPHPLKCVDGGPGVKWCLYTATKKQQDWPVSQKKVSGIRSERSVTPVVPHGCCGCGSVLCPKSFKSVSGASVCVCVCELVFCFVFSPVFVPGCFQD